MVGTHPECITNTATPHALDAEQHCRHIIASMATGVVVITTNGQINSLNPAAIRMLDLHPHTTEITRAHRSVFYNTDHHHIDLYHDVLHAARHHKTLNTTIGVTHTTGQQLWLSVHTTTLTPPEHPTHGIVMSLTDITSSYHITEKLAHDATHDWLTGLANRRFIEEWLTTTHTHNPHTPLAAVLVIDLDNFKTINDTLGHHIGDEVLRIVAARLNNAIRTNDIVARTGGDEFIILLTHPLTNTRIHDITTTLNTTLHAPLSINNTTIDIGASIGITTITPHDHRTTTDILHDADTAMYATKLEKRKP